MSEVSIRLAQPGDLAAVNEIYNHYVENGAVTFDLRPFSVDERRGWFERFAESGRYRLVVATRTDRVVGYAGSLPFRGKAAYDPSVELTIYLAPGEEGAGIGVALYERLFAELANEDVHRVLAGITLPNDASVRLHERFGFRLVGTFHEVGRKHDRYWDVAWYERAF